jgi:hypothetical protein
LSLITPGTEEESMTGVPATIYRQAIDTAHNLSTSAISGYHHAKDTAQTLSTSAISGSKQLASHAHATWQSNKPALERMISNIQSVVVPLLKVTIGLILFASQSTPYVVGIFVTILAPECMDRSVARISQIWNNLTLPGKAIAVVAGIIAFPITTAAAAFFAGAYTAVLVIPRNPPAPEMPLETISIVN